MGEMLIWGSGSITKKLSPIDGHLQRKNQFSTMKTYRVCKQHLRTGPLSSSRWPIQSEHNDGFLNFFFVSHCFIWSFLYFAILLFVLNSCLSSLSRAHSLSLWLCVVSCDFSFFKFLVCLLFICLLFSKKGKKTCSLMSAQVGRR